MIKKILKKETQHIVKQKVKVIAVCKWATK